MVEVGPEGGGTKAEAVAGHVLLLSDNVLVLRMAARLAVATTEEE